MNKKRFLNNLRLFLLTALGIGSGAIVASVVRNWASLQIWFNGLSEAQKAGVVIPSFVAAYSFVAIINGICMKAYDKNCDFDDLSVALVWPFVFVFAICYVIWRFALFLVYGVKDDENKIP